MSGAFSLTLQKPSTFAFILAASLACLSPAHASGRGAHTPPPGSAERAAILDALRRSFTQTAAGTTHNGARVVFTVSWLKVHDGWAWVQADPQNINRDGSKGGGYDFGTEALLHLSRGYWQVADWMGEAAMSGEETGAQGLHRLRVRHPQAPADIFSKNP